MAFQPVSTSETEYNSVFKVKMRTGVVQFSLHPKRTPKTSGFPTYTITGQQNSRADITTLGRINLPRQKLKYNSVCVRLCRPHSQLHPSAYFGSTATYLVRTIKEFRCIVLNFIFRTRVLYKIQFPEFGILSRNRDVNELFAFSDTFVGTKAAPRCCPDAYIYFRPIYNNYYMCGAIFENLIGSTRWVGKGRERERQICG